jgi:hypothetical protein
MKNTLTEGWMYSPRAQMVNQGVAMAVTVFFILVLANVGLQLAVIVGGSAIIGFFCWRMTNLRRAINPVKTAIVFLLTTAALHVHMYEEYVFLFGPAMSRLFNMSLSDPRFLQIFVFTLPTVYYLTAIGLLLRIPLAAFVAWFIFIGPGIAEFTHFIFPLLTPALEPANPSAITAVINGVSVERMPNHHVPVTGKYYFPGMYTAVLPMIPGIYSVWWLLKNRHAAA